MKQYNTKEWRAQAQKNFTISDIKKCHLCKEWAVFHNRCARCGFEQK